MDPAAGVLAKMLRVRLTGMTAGLTIGITGAVAAALGVGAYLYSAHHVEELLERDRKIALAQGELMRAALEHQMIENDRTLIAELVRTFSREPQVRRVTLLDRKGQIQYSSDAAPNSEELQIEGPTCQACHRLPPEQRANSGIIETSDGTVLRTVIPFRNRAACHRCHDPAYPINGVMLFDMDATESRTALAADMRWMVIGSSLLACALIAVLAIVVRVVVLRRLQRFETTARLIAAGDLDRRVPAHGSDTISWLATEFNSMADAMSGLIDDVRGERERLELVINSIDDGIVVLDSARHVVAANDAFLRRAGRDRRQVVGTSCRSTLAGACDGRDCPALACLASGERQIRLCERETTDGQMVWEEIHASPLRGLAGGAGHVVEVWRDISERRTAEAKLAESHRLASLGMLASGFSHELNTPLATVLTCVDGILRAGRTSDDGSESRAHVLENAAIAREQVLRCRGITQHFLRLSRGEQASADLLELGSVMSAVARLVDPALRERSVTLVVTLPSERIHVRINEAELQQALINLLLNAAQACAVGGRVGLDASYRDDIHIRITDDGCGVAPSEQQRIFEPFYSKRPGGTGLGLFVTQAIVRRAGGNISVSSVVGSGSTFDIVLPSADALPRLRSAS